MNGMQKIQMLFEQNKGRPLLMTHAVGGWPDLDTSESVLSAMLESGADMIEVQIPFSEPAADGPLIVSANHEALAGGVTTRKVLEMIGRVCEKRSLAGSGRLTSVLVMSYLNPILAYGEKAFVSDARSFGVDGLIVPDCAPDEISLLPEIAAEVGLAFVPLIAPDTESSRIEQICNRFCSPFVYAVLRYGVTGKSTSIDSLTEAYLSRVRSASGCAVAAGFGIRERRQVEALGCSVDCVVAGSVFIEAMNEAASRGSGMTDAVRGMVAELVRY